MLASAMTGLAANFFSIQPDGRVHGALVEPEHDAEGEEVLGEVHLLGGHLEALEGPRVERADGDLEDVVAGERAVVEGVLGVAGLGQVLAAEGVLVDDDGAARRQVPEVGLERRRVHRHEHVRGVAGRVDVRGREADLEAGDARQRARRGPDLGREVRQGGDVVAEDGRGARELRAGQLHAVARIAREPDRDALQLLDGRGGLRGVSVVTRGRAPRSRPARHGLGRSSSSVPRGGRADRAPAGRRAAVGCVTGSIGGGDRATAVRRAAASSGAGRWASSSCSSPRPPSARARSSSSRSTRLAWRR